MAHGGEKVALGPHCLQRGVAGAGELARLLLEAAPGDLHFLGVPPQLLLRPFPLGDVGEDAAEGVGLSVGVVERESRLEVGAVSAGAGEHHLPVERRVPLDDQPVLFPEDRHHRRREDLAVRAAGDLLPPQPRVGAEAPVGEEVPTFEALHEDQGRHVVDDREEPPLAGPERLLRLLPALEIREGVDDAPAGGDEGREVAGGARVVAVGGVPQADDADEAAAVENRDRQEAPQIAAGKAIAAQPWIARRVVGDEQLLGPQNVEAEVLDLLRLFLLHREADLEGAAAGGEGDGAPGPALDMRWIALTRRRGVLPSPW